MRNFIADTVDWFEDKFGAFGGLLVWLIGIPLWVVGSTLIMVAWASTIGLSNNDGGSHSAPVIAVMTVTMVGWPYLLVLIQNIVGFVLDQVADAKHRKLQLEKAEIERLEKEKLKAAMRANANQVRAKIKELENMLQKGFESELLSNIEEAKRAYPRLIETVKNEEAFLVGLSKRHPNIAGFVQTRSKGDSKKSDVAKLGKFLEKLEA
jgi:hypothetical protein